MTVPSEKWTKIRRDRRVLISLSAIVLSVGAIVVLIAEKPAVAEGVRGIAIYTGVIQALGAVAAVSFFTLAWIVGKALSEAPPARHREIARNELMEKAYRLGRNAGCSTNPNPMLIDEWTEDCRDYFFSALDRFLDDYDVDEKDFQDIVKEAMRGFDALIRIQPESHVAYALDDAEIEKLLPKIFEPLKKSPELQGRARQAKDNSENSSGESARSRA
jgi:hypothetical protein